MDRVSQDVRASQMFLMFLFLCLNADLWKCMLEVNDYFMQMWISIARYINLDPTASDKNIKNGKNNWEYHTINVYFFYGTFIKRLYKRLIIFHRAYLYLDICSHICAPLLGFQYQMFANGRPSHHIYLKPSKRPCQPFINAIKGMVMLSWFSTQLRFI